MASQAERIASLEARMATLEQTNNRIEQKLDELLALKNKGAGAFWLASMLFGTTVVSAITYLITWMKG